MKKRKKRRLNTGKVILVLSLVLMIITAIGVTVTSSMFDSKEVELVGNKELTKEEVIKILNISSNKNIFQYNINKMEKKLLEHNYIETVDIKRKFPDKLSITIKEKKEVAILSNKNNYCYIDSNGEFLKKIQEVEDKNKVIVTDIEYNIDKNNKISFKDEENKKRLLYLLNDLQDKKIYDRIANINFQNDDIINMKTINNIEILLPKDNNIDYNISRISEVLIDLQNKNKKNGTIDLVSSRNVVYRP
ncbi:cell division protein FtsQ [Romboutsia weinsteinii]|uniref:Cell division protein FtsQ n=1 Tax=Romboutsia weinsteinii TaxID=2020949 RepID=A0A371IZ15_9FIRM|nr:FtsQ-type POTRA domain-containing protein [Romboutsia weinsteinii]RDY25725.1 cell division protein FtsQ [Romboutsia weinsteinii]